MNLIREIDVWHAFIAVLAVYTKYFEGILEEIRSLTFNQPFTYLIFEAYENGKNQLYLKNYFSVFHEFLKKNRLPLKNMNVTF